MSDQPRNTGPMLASPRCGAPRGNRNALRHGLFTGSAIAEQKQIQDLLADVREMLQELK